MPADTGTPHARDTGGIVFSALFALVGVYALWDTEDMSPLGRVFPVTMASAMIVFALVYVVFAIARPRPPALRAEGESTPRRVALVVAMLAWVGAMPWLGFAVSGLGGFLAVAAVARHERWTPAGLLTHALVGVAVVAGFQALFVVALKVPLPKGVLF